MRFRRRVRNKKVIAIVLATIMAFVAIFTSCNHNQKNSNNKHHTNVTNVTYQKKQKKQQRHVKLEPRTEYHAKGNVYMKQGQHMKVNATAYCGDTITSTGTKPIEGRTIAVDPKIIPYGTKVYIPQFDKVFIAEDCGSAIKGNRIDIFMTSYNRAMDWGIRTIDIYIINE